MAAFSWEEEVWRVDAGELGDLDPLAPGGDVLTDAGGGDDDQQDVETSDGGSSDSRGIVRVWVDDGRLTKVRVSSQWHAKLGRGSLADCFAQALGFAHVNVASAPAQEERSYDDVDFSQLPRFDAASFAAFQKVFSEVEERWDEALARRDEDAPTPPTATTGSHKGVTVTLNAEGMADRVTFEKAWLETAQAGTICTHVMRAAEKAYAQFTPADENRAELDDIATEHAVLLAAFKAMLNPKERS